MSSFERSSEGDGDRPGTAARSGQRRSIFAFMGKSLAEELEPHREWRAVRWSGGGQRALERYVEFGGRCPYVKLREMTKGYYFSHVKLRDGCSWKELERTIVYHPYLYTAYPGPQISQAHFHHPQGPAQVEPNPEENDPTFDQEFSEQF
ncbi:unnamed protein product, partial [Mesorhabditis spiculigera]